MIFDPIFKGIATLLAACYSFTHNYALAIAVFTLIIMVAFTPLTLKSTRSMMAMQRLQPEIKRLQAKHKDDRQTLNTEMMALYQAEGVNPLGGCLPMLVQIPIFFILFRVLRGLTTIGDDGLFDPDYLDQGTELYKDLHRTDEMLSFGIDLA
ncbi:MAG: membrane protein insertase YidC, partial [Acidimicrobiales bacterium]|nr:membrane protein insertase YidC [Acidimicrobiales bacterium]